LKLACFFGCYRFLKNLDAFVKQNRFLLKLEQIPKNQIIPPQQIDQIKLMLYKLCQFVELIVGLVGVFIFLAP
jgi:hypothetical protein